MDDFAVAGFPPILPPRARILILGSMPGAESLARGQYYAHPQNAFWPIMASLFNFDSALSYRRRIAEIRRRKIALWDALARCRRRGSLDSAIARESESPNDIPALLRDSPAIGAIFTNGGKARDAFRRHILPQLGEEKERLKIVALPSTSPANARMRFSQKLSAWRIVADYLDNDSAQRTRIG